MRRCSVYHSVAVAYDQLRLVSAKQKDVVPGKHSSHGSWWIRVKFICNRSFWQGWKEWSVVRWAQELFRVHHLPATAWVVQLFDLNLISSGWIFYFGWSDGCMRRCSVYHSVAVAYDQLRLVSAKQKKDVVPGKHSSHGSWWMLCFQIWRVGSTSFEHEGGPKLQRPKLVKTQE